MAFDGSQRRFSWVRKIVWKIDRREISVDLEGRRLVVPIEIVSRRSQADF